MEMKQWPGRMLLSWGAAYWKGDSTNTIVCFPTVMMNSIALLEETYFESIGRAMPKGTGVDNSVAVAETAALLKKKRKKRGSYKKRNNNKRSPNYDAMLKALHQGTQAEAQLSSFL